MNMKVDGGKNGGINGQSSESLQIQNGTEKKQEDEEDEED